MSHDSGNGAPVAPSNFLRGIIEADQRSGKYAGRVDRQGVALPSVITRFPPEPNGYLHIGHAKSICLNFGLARDYGGRCHLRFDDTNPTKEEQEYVDTIIDSVEWLGFSWRDAQDEHKYFASDHFDLMYEMAEWLVSAGHAYVDSQSAEEMAANRGSFSDRERIDKLTAFDFAKLPLKDTIVIKQGTGARKLAVFVDPNCGYCKRFERDVAGLKNVTVYIFLYPILGPDSTTKSRDIWCAKDPAKAWRDWMINGTVPASTASAKCDTAALDRNTELGRKHRVQGTPATVFEDGSRSPGAIPVDEIEKRLAAAAGKG